MFDAVIEGVAKAIGDKINDFLPELVTEYRPVAWILYLGGAVALFAVPVTEGYRILTHPPPSGIPFWIVYGPSLLFGGMGIAAICGLVANERSRRGRGRQQPAAVSKTDGDYVVCPECRFEQWREYPACQKCGRRFAS